MPVSKNKETIVSIPYFNDEDVLNELIKFLQRLLLKKGVDKVYVEKISELSRDEIYKLHLTQKSAPSRDFKREAERYVHDYFILKENYLKEQLSKVKARKKSEDYIMQITPDVVPPQININNLNQSQTPQVVVRQTPQRVRRGTAAILRQQSFNNLSDQIAQISMVSRQLQQLKLIHQTQQIQVKTTPSNRKARAQQQEMAQQESHRLVPRPTLSVFNKLMAEQEMARKKKEEQAAAALKKSQEQQLANKDKLLMQPSIRPKFSKN